MRKLASSATLCPAMDHLWTPWRYAYVTTAGKQAGCIFFELPRLGDDQQARIVHRGRHCFVVLNTYPYTAGHVIVVPFAHLDELQKLSSDAAGEMMAGNILGKGYLAGFGLTIGSVFGRIAGREAARHGGF